MITGVGGQTADVINSSWGTGSTTTFNVFNTSLDGMVRQSAKTLVFSAGNSGPSGNTVFWPANGHNMITVGALGSDVTGYNQISSFSSRGPSDYNGPDGSFAASRARIDITAPGQNMTLAFYGGLTGGNVGGTDPSGGSTGWYTFNAQGTSFAAPTVSGGAALIVDAGKALFGGGESIDGRLVKSIIQTSASKPVGWNNGQTLSGGVISTTQSMDYAYGAGKLDLNNAYDIYVLGGTKNLAGHTGGVVSNTGWDVADVSENGFTDFPISHTLLGNTNLTATLNWFANSSYSGTNSGGGILANAGSFTNLGLEVWATDGTNPTSLVAESRALFITNQHLSFTLPNTGQYMLRVKWLGERYDFVNSSSERFALSWTSTAVPEPATLAALAFGAVCLRRRKKSS